MGLDSLEWVVIASIGIVVFLWGPKKIPEITRSIAGVRQKIQEASKELQFLTRGEGRESLLDVLAAPEVQADGSSAVVPASPASDSRAADQVLLETARRFGVVTVGKTKEQISNEILSKSKGTG